MACLCEIGSRPSTQVRSKDGFYDLKQQISDMKYIIPFIERLVTTWFQ